VTGTETNRLTLRNWQDSDVTPFIAHLNTPVVMQWLGGVQDDATARASIARWRSSHDTHGHGFWIVERQSDGAILGFCGIKLTDAPGAPFQGAYEIGWRLRADAWGMGYAREAAEAALTIAFTHLAAPEVVAITVRQNHASWGLMQRLGMHRSRHRDFVDHRMPAAMAANSIVYAITKGDWTQ
jgi:RimJ/RimL family protein N-acetyltransferase